jgi:hypothetical protein
MYTDPVQTYRGEVYGITLQYFILLLPYIATNKNRNKNKIVYFPSPTIQTMLYITVT